MNFTLGQQLATTSKGEITRAQLREYAQASGDRNPIHIDEQFAQDAGFPGVIAHGMLSMAFLGDYINEHFPPKLFKLVHFRARFKKITFPGDRITCHGKIKHIDADQRITVQLTTRNQNGEQTTTGEATVQRTDTQCHFS